MFEIVFVTAYITGFIATGLWLTIMYLDYPVKFWLETDDIEVWKVIPVITFIWPFTLIVCIVFVIKEWRKQKHDW